ncbi:hypothetical protein [Megasphaera sueciensis]|uniref:hypothetical protein n=1 Tax=Megasphaera sueciensis TaxID=349094 RepID=UPI003D032F7A
MDFLGLGMLIGIGVVGTIVFGVLLANSFIINPSLMRMFSLWLSCVVGTTVVGYILLSCLASAVGWVIDFIEDDYMYIIGILIILFGIRAWAKR